MKKMRKLFAFWTMLIALAIIAGACKINVGLGAAVDTEVPSLELDGKIPSGSIIRGPFTLAGTWSDDGKIDYIKVTMQNRATKISQEFKGECTRYDIDPEGPWSCTINPFEKDKPLVDGDYNVDILIRDTYGHERSEYLALTLDNTAPVVALTRPTKAMGETSFDSYGQEFSITGYIGDVCANKYISIEIYDSDKSDAVPVYKTPAPVKVNTEFTIVVAAHNSEDEILAKAYEAIYGKDTTGTKNLYCKIYANDEAVLFDEKGTDTTGNLADYYYLYDALYSDVFENYAPIEIYEMQNNSRAVEGSILDVLALNRISKGQFSVNPVNNPSFRVSGRSPLKLDGNDFIVGDDKNNITNGTTVVFEVDPGLDQTPLHAETLGLYVVEWDSTTNSVKAGAPELPLIKPLQIKKDNNFEINTLTDDEKKARNEALSNSGSQYKFKYTLVNGKNGLKIGTKYVFGIYGYDKKGIAVKNVSDTYGFLFSTNVAPEVYITEPKDLNTYLMPGKDFEIKGYAKTEVGSPDYIYFYMNGETEPFKTITGDTLTSKANGSKYDSDFSITIPAATFADGGLDEYSVEIKAVYCNLPTSVQRTIIYDTKAPTIDISSPAKDAWQSSIGQVQVNAEVTDNRGATEAVYYSTTATAYTEANKNTDWKPISSSINSKELVTTDKQGRNVAFISFVAIDKAKNISDVVTRYINVDSEKPVMNILSYNAKDGESQQIANGDSKPVQSKSFSISGNYSDSGTNVTVSVKREGESESLPATGSGSNAGTWTFTENDVAEGIYTYEITATDESGKFVTQKVTITADVSLPTAALSSGGMPDAESLKGSSFTFGGTASDGLNGSGVSIVQLRISDNENASAEGAKSFTANATGSTNWTYKVTYASENEWKPVFAEEGRKYVTLIVTDNAGNKNEISAGSFIYDRADPVLNVTYGATQEFMTEEGFSFEGTASDTYTKPVLKIVEQHEENGKFVETPASKNADVSTVAIDANGKWSAKVPLILPGSNSENKADGKYQYQFVLSDVVGHETASALYTTTVDKTAPTLTITNPVTTNGNSNKLGTSAIDESSFKFNGNIVEANGISGIWYQILTAGAETPIAPAGNPLLKSTWNGWLEADVGNESFKFTQEFKAGTSDDGEKLGEGNKKLVIIGVDTAGNVSPVNICLFDVDMSNPSLTSGITVGDNCKQNGNTYYFNSDKITGTYSSSDTNGVAKVEVKISGITAPIASFTSETGTWEIGKERFGDETARTVTITTTDVMGKETSDLYTVAKDVSAPVVGVSTPAAGDIINSASVSANGSISDAGVGVSKIEYTTDNGTTWEALTYSAGDTWTANLNFASEGRVTLKLRATDKLGNITPETAYASVTFDYDKALPVLTLTKPEAYQNAEFTVTGKAKDTNSIVKVDLFDNSNNEKKYTYTFTDEEKSAGKDNPQNWTYTFKTGSENRTHADYLAEGEHTFRVVLYDAADRTSETSFSVTVDTVAPVVTTPLPYPSVLETEKQSYRYIGEANDATSNVTKVQIAFADPEEETTVVKDANGSTSWVYNSTFAEEALTDGTKIFASSGEKRIYVRAQDRAGNWSTWTNQSFKYDTAEPVVAITNYTAWDSAANAYQTTPTELITSQFGTAEKFKLSGNISDDWGFDFTNATTFKITQKKDNGAEVDITSVVVKTKETVAAGEKYNWTLSDLPRDPSNIENTLSGTALTGEYTYKVTAKDKTGEKSVVKSTVCVIDVTPPNVEFTTPKTSLSKANYISDNSYTFYGKANDVGTAGVASYSYQFVKAANETEVPTADSTKWTVVEASDGNWSIEKTIETGTTVTTAGNLCEGKWFVFVKATDHSGNVSDTKVISFWIDDAAPVVTETTVGTTGRVTNAAVTLSGKVTETHGLASFVLKDSANASFSRNIVPDAETGNWSIILSVTGDSRDLADGTHEFTISATDIVERTSEIKRTVTVDTVAPTVGTAVTTPVGTDFDGTAVRFSGTANDGNPTSGLDTVTVWFTNGTNSSVAGYKESNKFTATGTGSWSYSVNVSDIQTKEELNGVFADEGTKYIYVKAADNAGNESATAVIKSFVYDKAAPVLETNYTVNETEASAVELRNNASITVNKTLSTLSGTFSDSGSPVTLTATMDGSAQTVTYTSAKSGNWSIDQSSVTDGNHRYVITATDESGRITTTNFTILIDTKAPEFTLPDTFVPSADETKSASYTFSGEATDANGTLTTSGIQDVRITIADKADSSKTKTVTATGTEHWNTKVTFSSFGDEGKKVFADEGVKVVTVTVTDKAGNSAIQTKEFTYDHSDPILTPTDSTVKTYMSKDGYTISGTATDTYKLGTLKVIEKFNGTVTSDSENNGKTVSITTADDKNGTWSVKVPLSLYRSTPVGAETDGVYTYQFILEDSVGHEVNSRIYTTTVDNTAPTVAVTTPAAAGLSNYSTLTFAGKVTEDHLATLTAVLQKKAASGKWTDTSVTSATAPITLNSDKSFTWTIYSGFSGDGEYRAKFIATDEAGLVNELDEAKSTVNGYSLVYTQDKTAPETTLVKTGTFFDEEGNSNTTPAFENTYFVKGEHTLSGTITEENFDSSKVTLKVNDGKTEAPSLTLNGKTWSFTGLNSKDGTYKYELTIVDKANNTAKKTITVKRDATAPVANIITPSTDLSGANAIMASSYEFKGTASDDLAGLKTFKYLITSTEISTSADIIASATSAASAGWITATASEISNGTWTLTKTIESGNKDVSHTSGNLYEGKWYIYVYAVDIIGNETTASRYFWVDKAAPTVSLDATATPTNGAVTLSLAASDPNGIKSVSISENVNSNSSWTATKNATSGKYEVTIPLTSDKTTAETGKLTDGEHTFTIVTTDNALRDTAKTVDVIVDRTPPTVTSTSFSVSPLYLDNGTYDTLTVVANDTIAGISTAGVADIYYQILGPAATKPNTPESNSADWVALSKSNTTTWASTINLSSKTDGTYYAFTKAVDGAGNEVISSTATTLTIDQVVPVVTIDGNSNAGSEIVSLTIKVTDTNPTKPTVTVAVPTGGKEITATVSDGTSSAAGVSPAYTTYTATIDLRTASGTPVVKDGTYTVTVKETDANGREAAEKKHTILRDVTPPTIAITSPESGSSASIGDSAIKAPGGLQFGGSSDDGTGSQVAAVWYKILKTSESEPTAPESESNVTAEATWTGAGWTKAGGSVASWNFYKNTIAGTTAESGKLEEGRYALYVYAVDKAGNISSREKVAFDVDAGKPVITTEYKGPADTSYAVFTGTKKPTGTYGFRFVLSDTHGIEANAYGTGKAYSIAATRTYGSTTTDVADTDITVTSDSGYYVVTIKNEDSNSDGTKDYQADGTYTYTIKTKDKAGRETEVTREILLDTSAPAVTVTSPDDFDVYQTSSTVKFVGSASDESGVSGVYYTTDLTVAENVPGTAEATTETNWTNKGWKKTLGTATNWNFTLDNLTESKTGHKVYIAAVDINGKTTSVSELTATAKSVKVDLANPTLEETKVTTNGLKTNGGTNKKFTLSGTMSDAVSGLKSLKIMRGLEECASWTAASGDTDTIAYVADDNAWTVSFDVGSESGKYKDGSYTFTITATDNAGRTSSIERTVVVDTVAPTMEEITLGTTLLKLDESTYLSVEAKASDSGTNASGIKQLYYIIQSSATAPGSTSVKWTALNKDNASWKATLNLNEKDEGTYYVFIKAEDEANNATVSTGKTFVIDKVKPVTAVSGKTEVKSEEVTLTIKVTDTNPTKPTVTVAVPTGGKEITAAVSEGVDTPASGDAAAYTTYTAIIDLRTVQSGTAVADGTYTVTVKETDANGREAATVTHKITRDTVAPTVTVGQPSADGGYVTAESYNFKVSVSDGTGTGVKSLKYAFDTSSTAPAAGSDKWEIADGFTGGDKFIEKQTLSGTIAGSGTNAGKLHEGEWYLFYETEDNSGNKTSGSRKFFVDLTAPTLSVTNTLTESGKNSLFDEIKNEKWTFSGTASDYNSMDSAAAVKVTVDGVVKLTMTAEQLKKANGAWTVDVTAGGNTDGNLKENKQAVVNVTAKDASGKITSKTYNVYYDTKDPSLEITGPVEGEQVENNEKVIKGSIGDEGYGIKVLEFELRKRNATAKGYEIVKDKDGKEIKGSTLAANADGNNYPLEITGESWKYTGTEGKISLGTAEGEIYLYVKATEDVPSGFTGVTDIRKGYSEQTVTFYYDKADPEIRETSVGDSELKTNEAFTLTGKVWDSNNVDYIKVVMEKAGGSSVTYNSNDAVAEGKTKRPLNLITTGVAAIKSETEPTGNPNWEMKFATSLTDSPATDGSVIVLDEDGTYTFKIYVYDISGKSSQITRKVTVDTVAPDFTANSGNTINNGYTSSSYLSLGDNKYFNTQSIDVKATVDKGTGTNIAKIEVKVNDGAYSVLSAGASTGIGKVSCNDGLNTIKFKATDEAGNTAVSSDFVLYIDTTAPNFAKSYLSDGTTELTGTKLSQGTAAYEFVVKTTDNVAAEVYSDVESVKVKLNHNTDNSKSKEYDAVHAWKNETGDSATYVYTKTTLPVKSGSSYTTKAYVEKACTTEKTISAYSYTADSITITVEGKVYTLDGDWIVIIPANANDSNPINQFDSQVTAIVKDKVGNESINFSLFTLQVDSINPEVEFDVIADADGDTSNGIQVNKTITISGTASDNNALESVILEYLSAENTWTEVPHTNETVGTYSWKYEGIDTTGSDATYGITNYDSDSEKTGVQLKLRATATDRSGRTTSKETTVTIDQDTDRPIISFNDIRQSGMVLSTKKVTGTISDDDGIESFKYVKEFTFAEGDSRPADWSTAGYYSDASCEESKKVTTFAAGTYYTPTVITPDASGSWSVRYDTDGSNYNWLFAVKDAKGGIFFTNNSDTANASLTRPKIVYADATTPTDNTSSITFSIDTAAPVIPSAGFKLSREAKTVTTAAADYYKYENNAYTTGVTWSEETAYYGADFSKLYAYVKVKENTGMAATNPVELRIGDTQVASSLISRIRTYELNGDTYYEYVIGPVDLSAKDGENYIYPSERLNVVVTVRDVADTDRDSTLNVIVDNSAPVSITNESPTSSEEEYATFTYSGLVSDNTNGSGIKEIRYYIPTYAEYFGAGASEQDDAAKVTTAKNFANYDDAAGTGKWKLTTTATSNFWNIEFTENNSISRIIGYDQTQNTVGQAYSAFAISDDVYKVPVWFKITDNVGNVGYVVTKSIRYNVNGDRPNVEITYPVHNLPVDAPTYVQAGGNVRISGVADDNYGVKAVYLNFDLSGARTVVKNEGAEDTDRATVLSDITTASYVNIPQTEKDETFDQGILVQGTKSWKQNIDLSNIKVNSVVRVRAKSVDINSENTNESSFASAWSDWLEIKVNNTNPVFSDVQLERFKTGVATAVAEQDFIDNMYLANTSSDSEGQWYLTGRITAGGTAGFESVNITGSSTGSLSSTDIFTKYKADGNAVTGTEKEKYVEFKIPVGTTTNSTWAISITATDGSNNNYYTTQSYTVKIDNTAPTFKPSDSLGSGKIKLWGNDYGQKDLSTDVVKNSDGQNVSIFGKIYEDGSGYGKIAVYAERKALAGSNRKNRIYNPLVMATDKTPANSYATTRVDLDSDSPLTGVNLTSGKVYINSNNLPVMYVTANTSGREVDSITSDALKNCAAIGRGGLIKIGGIYRTITDVDTTNGTVKFTPQCSTSYTTAEVVFAMIIDHAGEKIDNSKLKSVNDDGDEMYEEYNKEGSDYSWNIAFDSSRIPDGDIELHVVTFDAAGNIGHGYCETTISNSAPRIARVLLGTDLNGNGKIDYADNDGKTIVTSGTGATASKTRFGEFVYYSTLGTYDNKSNQAVDNVTLDSSDITIKNGMMILPEFVGGNVGEGESLGYTVKVGNSEYTGTTGKSTGTTTSLTAKATLTSSIAIPTGSVGTADSLIDAKGGIYFANNSVVTGTTKLSDLETIKSSNDDTQNAAAKYFAFTIWDKTEETTPGTNSQYAILQVPVKIDTVDDYAPTATINPFYWNDKDNNSLFENSTANGHIELESDWENASGYDSSATSGVSDRDPKVSGKVVVTGQAYDETKLKTITVEFDNHRVIGTYGTPWTYKSQTNANSTWSDDATTSIDFVLEITDENNGPTKDGHSVTWTFTMDTSKASKVAQTDVAVIVTAVDASTNGNGSTPGTTQTTSAADGTGTTGCYKMDVVPYVTSVGTKFAGKDKNIKGSYSRTSSGKYIVASDETGITLSGFNLTGGKVVFNGTNAEDTLSSGKFKIPAAARTGAFKVQVNNVDSLNNLNNNNSAGDSGKTISDTSSYSDMTNYAYNRCPNNISNNLLTDDLWFDIWELNNRAATSRGALKDPVMHINQGSTDKEIGFGFVNSADGVSFPASGNSYVWFQKNRKDYKGTNFVYDNNGVAHNISIGLDAQASTGIAGRMNYNNSNWYSTNSYGSDAGNNGEGTISQWNLRYNIALETIGIPKGVNLKGTTLGANIIDTDRFVTPSIAVSTHGDNKTPTVYIMYYDTDHQQIRFRYGEINQSGNLNANSRYRRVNNNDQYESYGLLNDSKSENHYASATSTTITIPSDTVQNNNTWANHNMFEASKDYYALVAGKYYKQTNNTKADFDTGNKGSAYYGLDVVPGNAIGNDKVVMIWYDESTQNLMYMYRENLTAAGDNTDASSNGVTNKWSKPVALVEDTLLQDCVIKVDSKGGIHIAYYDQTNADLIYGYMSGYNKASEFKTCVVDAYSQVGNRISIDTAVHATNGKVVPYISYFSDGLSSLPKMAYLPNGVSSADNVVDGADADTTLFTGNWEVTLIPTASVLQAYNVGIGIWKDANNKATIQTAKADVAYSTTNYNQKCYANGTSELVVGYSIKANGVGYMETAMRR